MPRLITLGRFELTDDSPHGEPMSIQPKRLALLAYLAVVPLGESSKHRRDTLVGLFWPELAQDDARRALRNALHHLRKSVGADAVITRTDEEISLDLDIVHSDQSEFELAVAERRYSDALRLYRGDFLDGVFIPDVSSRFEDWIDRTRVRMRNRAVEAARCVLSAAESEGRSADALAAAFRAFELAPEDEAVLRQLLSLLHRSGDKTGALRAYDTFARRLKDEIGVTPEPATVTLYEALRQAASVDMSPALDRRTEAGENRDAAPTLIAAPADSSRSISKRSTGTAILGARSRLMLASAALGMVVVIAGAWLASTKASQRERVARSIAVIPFEVENKDTAAVFFADGMTQEIGAALGRAGIRVAARGSVAAIHARPGGDASLRKLLGVGLLLHGRVQRSGDRLRVWTQLVNGEDGIALWTRSYDTTMTDVFHVQEDLAQAIVREMRPTLGASVASESSRSARGTNDVEAYDSFLKGRYYADRLQSDLAIASFKHAISRDPSYARSWAALSRAYANLALSGTDSTISSDSLIKLASRSAAKAVQLDPKIADGYAATGVVLLTQWNFSSADLAFQRAIALEPGNPDNYLEYCSLLFEVGRVEDGVAEVQKIRDLDPLSVSGIIVKQYGLTMLGRWKASEIETNDGLSIDASLVPIYQNAGIAEAFEGNTDSAFALLKKGYDIDPRVFGNAAYGEFGFAVKGRWKDVDRVRRENQAGSANNSPNFLRTVDAVIDGDTSLAVDAMQRAFENREPMFLFVTAACDPMFDLLHSDTRFRALMARYGMRPCPVVGKWPIPRRQHS